MSFSDHILNIEGCVSAHVLDEGVGSSLLSKDTGSFVNNRICFLRGFKRTNFLWVATFLNEAQCFDSLYFAEGISLLMLDLIMPNHLSVSDDDPTKIFNYITSIR